MPRQLPADALAPARTHAPSISRKTCSSRSSTGRSPSATACEFSAKIRDEVSSGDRTGIGTRAQRDRSTRTTTTSAIELSWKHSADRWLNEVQLTYEDAFYVPQITNSRRQRRGLHWFNWADDPNVLAVGWRRPARRPEQRPEGLGDRRQHHLLGHLVGCRRSHHQGRREVQGRRSDRPRTPIPDNPVFYYDVTGGGHGDIPWKAAFALPLAGFESEVDRQRQAVRRVRRRTTGPSTIISRSISASAGTSSRTSRTSTS